MQSRRVVAAVAAVILAVVGALALFTYVNGADKRALAGMETQRVLVVTEAIPRGTASSALGSATQVKDVPKVAVASGAVTDVAQLSGKVASVDLVVGEQVLASRFVDPSVVDPSSVPVPDGMEQVSIVLEPERVIGAHLKAGDTVGVISSFTFKGTNGGDEVETTHLMLSRVLVTRVAGAQTTAGNGQQSPTNAVMVTFAVTAPDAEKVVFAKEYGKVWLTLEGEKSDQAGTRLVTGGNIYK